jgi:general secretion pathway protein I
MSEKEHGFSLVEAVVALVILSASGIALATWFSLSMENLIRLEEKQRSQLVLDNLFEYFSTLQLKEEKKDEQLDIEDYDIVWSATLVEPEQVGRSLAGTISNFDLALYRIEFTIKKGQVEIGQFQTKKTGFKKVRGQ